MRIVLCGVRGSTPAPGPDFVRYGGHTSCVALAHDGEAPSLLLDAGTGLRRLTGLLDGGPFRGSILLGHLHWDHTHGLPFCPAVDRDDAAATVYVPAQGDALDVLTRAMSPPHFPITPDQLRGAWGFRSLEPGTHEIEGFTVTAAEVPHKGGRTFGFRVGDERGVLTYVSDHCPTELGPGPDGLGERHEAVLELARGADVLLHDAQYLDEELPAKAHFGHAAVGYAVGLAEAANVRRLVLFHHDPSRTDEQLDDLAATWGRAGAPSVTVAREGDVIELPGADGPRP